MSERNFKLIIALILLVVGALAMNAPELVFSLILNLAVLFATLHGLYKVWCAIHDKSRMELLFGLISFSFGLILTFYTFLPEWIIRVTFGIYCSAIGLSMALQQVIYIYNETAAPISRWIFSIAYFMMGFMLLFSPNLDTEFLMRLFGGYFVLLGFRYFLDALDLNSRTYTWHRSLHVSLPTAVAALIPDFYLNSINSHFQKGEDYPSFEQKGEEKPLLKAMVHIGPDGFQKMGHFSFAYKGVVYSYGNYDARSGKLFGLLGDGVYFNVPEELYLPNIMQYEKNTIFEYGIHISPEQEEALDAELERLKNNSFRWYCDLEKNDGIYQFEKYASDYPCRLHYRTGAKFYKIKKGQLKTYWVLGENCVRFADRILGIVGTDVLSIRGIITPGSYFDYLQNEYQKENSPVISCVIHPYRPMETEEEEVLPLSTA